MTVQGYVYRSDWPEKGFQDPLYDTVQAPEKQDLVEAVSRNGLNLEWVAAGSEFEEALYGLPFWNLHLRASVAEHGGLAAAMGDEAVLHSMGLALGGLLGRLPRDTAYVSTRIVSDSALNGLLQDRGFSVVEHRRLYTGLIATLRRRLKRGGEQGLHYAPLAAFTEAANGRRQEEVLGICRSVFEGRGHSRYFNDPVLLERRPGLDYILAVMRRNFEFIPSEHIFLALDGDASGPVVGFTVLGQKPGLLGKVYSQLLSAVLPEHQGRGIYYGLTRIMASTLARDIRLLNVTHAANTAIQRAYHNSGRIRLADTLVYRRLLSA